MRPWAWPSKGVSLPNLSTGRKQRRQDKAGLHHEWSVLTANITSAGSLAKVLHYECDLLLVQEHHAECCERLHAVARREICMFSLSPPKKPIKG
eukprot:8469247-Prorocentrum_lima.AAC.1